jgi:hypothetical protein
MHKLAVIHFNPIELYPPAMNWVNYLGEQPLKAKIKVFTSQGVVKKRFDSKSPSIKIIRAGFLGKQNFLKRYWNYLVFYGATMLKLLYWRPDTVLYYETYSALPAFLYKRFFNRGSRLFIHYHE